MITVKRLVTAGQIEEACYLLHRVYIEQVRWQFGPDNPSELRIESSNGRRVLLDRFVDSAVWFGAYDKDKIVGCIRVCGVDENNLLEFEAYPTSQVVQRYLTNLDRKNCVELSKLAVNEDYVGRGIVKTLLLACFRYCVGNQYSAVTLTSHGYLKVLYRKIDFPLKKENAFKYESTDSSLVNFYHADFNNAEVTEILKKLEYLENDLTNNSRNIFKSLQTLESIMPTPFYWMDSDGVVLGINDLCLEAIGTTRDIVGKKPYEFYKEDIADHILEHNAQVIRTGEIQSQEEWIEDVTTKKKKCFSAIKSPLYDDQGAIIGIIGTSIEITAEKEAEYLRLENQAQKSALEEHKKVTVFARKVAHDLNSPIAALKMCIAACTELSADKMSLLTRTIDRLSTISNNLLDSDDDNSLRATLEPQKPLIVHEQISQILAEKHLQFQNEPVVFELNVDERARAAMANIQSSQFKRALSNLINNAVEALPDNSDGTIKVAINVVDDLIVVNLEDNGKGLTQAQIDKLLNRNYFTEGKANGHGLGLQQVWDMLDMNNGKMTIKSHPGQGSVFKLSFPYITVTRPELITSLAAF